MGYDFYGGKYIENVSNLPNGDNSNKKCARIRSIFSFVHFNRKFALVNSILWNLNESSSSCNLNNATVNKKLLFPEFKQ